MEEIADAIRKVTAGMQGELANGRRSTHVDANDLIDVLLAIADELDPPFAPTLQTKPRRKRHRRK